MKPIDWSIAQVTDILKTRVKNKFDSNFAVSGERGNGKSTFINKILYRFNGDDGNVKFDPWTHQVYKREDVINLLQTQEFGICWDDEAINSGYKRDFQNKGQQEMIKIITAYRDRFNVYASAIPNFFSLDKDLRDLFFMHFHIIKRGMAVMHMPLKGRLYSQDKWDANHNAKIEAKWGLALQKNPNFKIPYHKLTTFKGYVFYNDLTELQKKIYLEIKKSKRAEAFEVKEEKKEKTFLQKCYEKLLTKTMSRDFLVDWCSIEGQKYSKIVDLLNRELKDNGIKMTMTEYLIDRSRTNKLSKG